MPQPVVPIQGQEQAKVLLALRPHRLSPRLCTDFSTNMSHFKNSVFCQADERDLMERGSSEPFSDSEQSVDLHDLSFRKMVEGNGLEKHSDARASLEMLNEQHLEAVCREVLQVILSTEQAGDAMKTVCSAGDCGCCPEKEKRHTAQRKPEPLSPG
ncbi:hypothetical protein CB1_000917007 [Camelus ferus]|nr:hypothetical protein CB1_000917007 [Camelus ferus]